MAGPAEDGDDMLAELFGDDDFGDEAPAAAAEASASSAATGPAAAAAPAASAEDPGLMEEDLFGDFNSEEEEAEASQSSKRPREGGEAGSSSGAPGEPTPKVRRRVDVSKFFETEAEEAGGGSGDEEDQPNLDGLIDDTGADTSAKGRAKLRAEMQRAANDMELGEVQREMEARGPESGARRVFGSSFLDRLEQKYQELDEHGGAAAPRSPGAFSQRSDGAGPTNTHIVPAPQDPKLWRCRTFASEKDLCISLMLKSGEWFAKGKQVPIFSVFYSQHQRGYIYIEAFREADIRNFVKGIRGISPWAITVVPLAQMPQVFQASVTDAGYKGILKVGDWVRMKRKPYNGDLARIEEVLDDEVTVKLKPRIQYKIEAGEKAADKDTRDARKRPQARWFNKTDLEGAGIMCNPIQKQTSKGPTYFFQVLDDIYRDGFLYKTLRIGNVETGDQVRPQEHELQDWRLAPPISEQTRPAEDLDLDRQEEDRKLMPPPALIPKKVAIPVELVEGDVVIVSVGELVNLRGRVVKAMFGATSVTVRPMEVGLTADVNLAISTLSKYFEVGDYVKVIAGDRTGDTGYVMSIDFGGGAAWNKDSQALVLSSSITKEFQVRVESLRLTAQKADQEVTLEGFRVGEMVEVDGMGASRGVIVRIESSGMAEVLVPNGSKIKLSMQELTPLAMDRRKIRSTWTVDRRGIKISPGCVVKAPRGQQKAAPIKAEIMFIHNDTVFLKAEEGLTGERAYLVCNGKKTEYVWDKNASKELERSRPAAQQLEEPKPELEQGKLQFGIQMASETDWLSPWFKKMMGIEDATENVTQRGAPVRITGGGYKGLRAEVRDFLGDKVRVSLLCKPKLVTVAMSNIAPDGYSNKPKKRKPVQGTEPAPGTPPDDTAAFRLGNVSPVPEQLKDSDGSVSQEQQDHVLGNENSWDPSYLMSMTEGSDSEVSSRVIVPVAAPPMPPALAGVGDAAAATPVPVPDGDGLSTPVPPTASAFQSDDEAPLVPAGGGAAVLPVRAKKRRQGVLPTPDGVHTSPSPARIPSTTPGVMDSPSSVWPINRTSPTSGPPEVICEPWLTPFVGVLFTRDTVPCRGWILQVYGQDVVVVPESAEVGDESVKYNLKSGQLQPWECDSRGDDVLVTDGPRRGSRGKVLGIEKTLAYVRPEAQKKNRNSLFTASVAGMNLVSLRKKDLVKFNSAWEKEVKERAWRPAKPVVVVTPAEAAAAAILAQMEAAAGSEDGDGPTAAAAAEEDGAASTMAAAAMTEAASEAAAIEVDADIAEGLLEDLEEAAAAGVVDVDGEATPGPAVGADSMAVQMSESPLTVGDLTPRPLLINETPPTSQLGRTPLSESEVTPAPLEGSLGNVTPMLPQGNFTPGLMPGGPTPVLPLGTLSPGGQTPVLPAGNFTPGPSGLTPDGLSPGMAPMPMPGSETPLPGNVKSMPGGATPTLHGQGGDAKLEVFGLKAKSDMGSPAGVAGATTPPPNMEKAEGTPAEGTPADGAKREGVQTPFDAGAGSVKPGGEGAQ